MNRKLELLRATARMLFQFLFAMLAASAIIGIYKEEKLDVIFVGGILVAFVISYITRAYAPNLPVIIIVHMILAGPFLITPYSLEHKIVFECVCMYLVVTSIDKDRKAGVPPIGGVPVFTLLMIFAMLMLAYKKEMMWLVRLCYVIPVIMIFLYIIMVYLDGLKNYMSMTQSITGIPTKRLVFTNSIFIAVILLVFFVALMILNLFGIKDDAFPLAKGIASAVLLVAYGLVYGFGFICSKLIGDSTLEDSFEETKKKIEEEAPNRVGDVLDMLLKIAVVLIIIYVLYLIIKKIGQYILTRKQNTTDLVEKADEVENLFETHESIKKKEEKSSHEEKIRKMYRNRILKHKHFLYPSKFKSVRDYEASMKEQELGDIEEMTDLYSKVRYSNIEADKQLVKEMKELSKK